MSLMKQPNSREDEVSASVKLVVSLGVKPTAVLFESTSTSDRVLSSDTDTVDKEGPGVADDPAVQVDTPCGDEHGRSETQKDRVLDRAPSEGEIRQAKSGRDRLTFQVDAYCASPPTNVVSFPADQNLTDYDTDDLQILRTR